jgi:hypothetical protein
MKEVNITEEKLGIKLKPNGDYVPGTIALGIVFYAIPV